MLRSTKCQVAGGITAARVTIHHTEVSRLRHDRMAINHNRADRCNQDDRHCHCGDRMSAGSPHGSGLTRCHCSPQSLAVPATKVRMSNVDAPPNRRTSAADALILAAELLDARRTRRITFLRIEDQSRRSALIAVGDHRRVQSRKIRTAEAWQSLSKIVHVHTTGTGTGMAGAQEHRLLWWPPCLESIVPTPGALPTQSDLDVKM